jgi:hypothetical protein
MPNASDQSYKHRLGAVLRRRDPVQLQLFLGAGAAAYGDDEQVRDVDSRGIEEMEELMHRMILARPIYPTYTPRAAPAWPHVG